jgi:hypothetical protein
MKRLAAARDTGSKLVLALEMSRLGLREEVEPLWRELRAENPESPLLRK